MHTRPLICYLDAPFPGEVRTKAAMLGRGAHDPITVQQSAFSGTTSVKRNLNASKLSEQVSSFITLSLEVRDLLRMVIRLEKGRD